MAEYCHNLGMSRQSAPSLTRQAIVRTALTMVERDGYAAFTMPRLGDELGVRTASLYHHFRDRADILTEIARTIVLETDLPRIAPSAHWTEYFVTLAVNFRRTILRHRNAAPILLQFLPRDVLTPLYETAAQVLDQADELAPSSRILVLDGMDRIGLGSALLEAAASPEADGPFPNASAEAQPTLTAALTQNALDAEQLFVESIRAFLAGVLANQEARGG
ncbi:TetR/AcrR family transcriptional regulator [Pseudofrankia inefficax]|uniref:TetR/AcrR family transcriptional regulator n=1 Tax=Pseudofrankia inefficax (strain DSM 45817 / CECT 9037 / DDB 130130 / EuI1c) TaxID=298654 RepID=UPI0012FDD372|nr:TetR family transcriptional regulator [Pseudofrankia inefficax]